MRFLKSLKRNPTYGFAVGGLLIVFAVAAIGWQWIAQAPSRPRVAAKAFFSDDDGKTWFVAGNTRVPPFDHDGKTAYRAYVFRAANGKEFVNHLESYASEDKAIIERAAASSSMPNAVAAVESGMTDKALVKKPGAAKWVKLSAQTSAEYSRVINPVSPDGLQKGIVEVEPN